MSALSDYVLSFTERGACCCGKCFDAPKNPEQKQPNGHTVNLTFFEVFAKGGDKEDFLSLVRKEHPEWSATRLSEELEDKRRFGFGSQVGRKILKDSYLPARNLSFHGLPGLRS